MAILEEIRENFAAAQNGIRKLTCLPEQYSAWTIRRNGEYGVAIPFNSREEILERFASAKLCNEALIIENKQQSMLILSCTIDEYRYEFASICAQFIDPGKDGSDRKAITESPREWWKRWKLLLGNAVYEKQVYSVIGELLALRVLIQQDKTIQWTGANAGTHDIESSQESYEVKSTIKKYGTTITISGQHQLKSSKKLYLYFCRLEKSQLGESINDLVKDLVEYGYEKHVLETQLNKMGFELGTSIRDEKYKVLEKRKYVVNEAFPQITDKSFVGGKIPNAIIKIQYTVDLEGLAYEEW